MRRESVFTQWIITLLLAPFTHHLIELIFGKNLHEVVSPLDFYPITLIISGIFSLPILILCLMFLHYSNKYTLKGNTTVYVVNGIAALGALITILLIQGFSSYDIAVAYSFTTIMTGLVIGLIQYWSEDESQSSDQ